MNIKAKKKLKPLIKWIFMILKKKIKAEILYIQLVASEKTATNDQKKKLQKLK